jgi:hypothetical protein
VEAVVVVAADAAAVAAYPSLPAVVEAAAGVAVAAAEAELPPAHWLRRARIS